MSELTCYCAKCESLGYVVNADRDYQDRAMAMWEELHSICQFIPAKKKGGKKR